MAILGKGRNQERGTVTPKSSFWDPKKLKFMHGAGRGQIVHN